MCLIENYYSKYAIKPSKNNISIETNIITLPHFVAFTIEDIIKNRSGTKIYDFIRQYDDL